MLAKALVFNCLAALFSMPALAQESEFKQKLQEDLAEYESDILSSCGAKVSVAWAGGALGSNPRESGVSTACTSATSALVEACTNNAAVKKKLGKLKKVVCKKGKGTLAYALAGSTITFMIDTAFTANNVSGQTADLVKKMTTAIEK